MEMLRHTFSRSYRARRGAAQSAGRRRALAEGGWCKDVPPFLGRVPKISVQLGRRAAGTGDVPDTAVDSLLMQRW